MRALIQRVTDARVTVGNDIVGETGPGLLILVCAMQNDTEHELRKLATKISKLRILKDESGRMNRAILDADTPSALVVSQFTLAADTRSGNRPGFSAAAPPDEGRRLYEYFTACLYDLGVPAQTGEFGADMAVTLTNDGPVTIWLDTDQS